MDTYSIVYEFIFHYVGNNAITTTAITTNTITTVTTTTATTNNVINLNSFKVENQSMLKNFVGPNHSIKIS